MSFPSSRVRVGTFVRCDREIRPAVEDGVEDFEDLELATHARLAYVHVHQVVRGSI